MFKLDLEKAEESQIKSPKSVGSSRKQESSRKTFTSALLTMPKPLTVWITTNWKILKEMGIPGHLTGLLRSLYAGQEATVRTGHRTADWFQIGKGVHQGCILSSCSFNLNVEYIMRNAGLEETQAGIKIARRNINNLRYADDTTLIHKRHGFNPWVGKIPWKRTWQPTPYSCLGNPRDRGAWQAKIHTAAQSWTQLKQLSTHAQTRQGSPDVNFQRAMGTSLAVQWLRLGASTAGGIGLIPGLGTKIPTCYVVQPKKKEKQEIWTSHQKRYIDGREKQMKIF